MTEPRILIGDDALLVQLPALLRARQRQRVLFAAGPHFLRCEAGEKLLAALSGSLSAVKAAPGGLLQAASIREEALSLPGDFDAVVAVGGGRSIDYAKALVYYSKHKPDLFVAVPTTAGSGSDATSFAVVYDGVEKLSLAHPVLLPNVVVWEASLLEDLPQRQRAISGLDALVQCLESLWSLRATTASRAFAWEAGGWLWKQLPSFVSAPTPELAIGALYAAHYSGRAINISRTSGPHALSYYLTALHSVDHGHAVALLFSVFLRYNAASLAIDPVLELLEASDAEAAVEKWQHYVRGLGLETDLNALGVPASVVAGWLQHVNGERFSNNPVALHPERLQALLLQTLFP